MENQYRKKLLHTIAMIIIMIIFTLLPPFGNVTEYGMTVIGIFIATIYGWIFLDLTIASVISIVALCVSGSMTANEVMTAGFGNYIVAMCIVFLFIAAAVQQLDIGGIIIDWMMSLKISVGRPWIKAGCFIFAFYFVSILTISNVAIVMAIPFFYSLMKRSGMKPHSPFCHILFGGVAFACFAGDAALPFKQAPLLYFSCLEAAGITVDPGRYIFAFPFICVMLIMYILVCKYIFRIDASCMKNLDKSRNEKLVSLSDRQKAFLGFLAALLIFMLLPGILPQNWNITVYINRLGTTGIPFLFMALMLLVQVEDAPLLDIPRLAKDFQWPVIIMLANFMPLSNLMSSDAVGLKQTIATVFGPSLSAMSPLFFTLVVVSLAVLATNFLNNGVVFMLFISAVALMADSLPGVNILAVSYLIGLGATMCYALPSGNMMMAYMYSFKDLINVKEFALRNTATIILLTIFACTVGFYYYNAVM